MISEITVEDDALFECQVGASQHTSGLVSRKAKLTVQGYLGRCRVFFPASCNHFNHSATIVIFLLVMIKYRVTAGQTVLGAFLSYFIPLQFCLVLIFTLFRIVSDANFRAPT